MSPSPCCPVCECTEKARHGILKDGRERSRATTVGGVCVAAARSLARRRAHAPHTLVARPPALPPSRSRPLHNPQGGGAGGEQLLRAAPTFVGARRRRSCAPVGGAVCRQAAATTVARARDVSEWRHVRRHRRPRTRAAPPLRCEPPPPVCRARRSAWPPRSPTPPRP
jgi:hypothetical protein